jgi:hypothetical protein
MKAKRTLLLTVLCSACNVMGQLQMEQHTQIKSAAPISTVGKVTFHWLGPVEPAKGRESLEPVEGISPQVWTTTVGWHPGGSAFQDDVNSSTGMPIFWFGHEPWQ